MATNIYPVQERTIDPYASYNSDCANRLTRMVSNGSNCIFGPNSLQISKDLTYPATHLVLEPGKCFKDDVLITITNQFTFDMTDPAFYYQAEARDIVGTYYIVLDYTYLKSRPAPKASIKILKPDQHGALPGLIFLKAVIVEFNTLSGMLETGFVYDWDPDDADNAQRTYSELYAAARDTIPLWLPKDEGRILYVRDENELYFGTNSNWESFSGIRDNVDTLSSGEVSIGFLGYYGYIHDNELGDPIYGIKAAISTSTDTIADCVVMSMGYLDGKVRLAGRADLVPIESGVTVVEGEKLFLSQTQAGSVTNICPSTGTTAQQVGTCILNHMDGTLYMWFYPGFSQDLLVEAKVNTFEARYNTFDGHMYTETISLWVWDPARNLYQKYLNHGLNKPIVMVQCYDVSTNTMTIPADITIVDENRVIIWMESLDTSTPLNMNVIIIG